MQAKANDALIMRVERARGVRPALGRMRRSAPSRGLNQLRPGSVVTAISMPMGSGVAAVTWFCTGVQLLSPFPALVANGSPDRPRGYLLGHEELQAGPATTQHVGRALRQINIKGSGTGV